MKHLIIPALLCVAVLLASAAQAESLTVDQLLARSPADSPAEADANSALLLALGPDAVRAVVDRLALYSEEQHLPAEYAVTGLARYVSTGTREEARVMTARVFLDALADMQDREVRAFLIRQLELMGGPEAIPALEELLAAEELADPARQALVAMAAVPFPTPARLEDMPGPAVSPALLALQGHLEAGATRRATRQARQLVREARTPEHERLAALQALSELQPARALDAMRELLREDTPPGMRQAVLQLAAAMEDERAAGYWSQQLRRMPPEQAVEVLEMLGQRRESEALPAVFRAMDHEDVRVRIAAIHALEEIERDRAFRHLLPRREQAEHPEEIAVLDALLGDADPEAPAGLPADEDGFIPLFNGRDLTGWVGDTRGYYVEDGIIVCTDVGHRLYTANEYSDFIFRFEFRLTPGANNGIGVRHELGTHAAIEAMEIQILDDSAEKYAELEGWQYNGAIYGIVAPELGRLKPVGEWNEMVITANGPQITVELNGTTIADADVHQAVEGGTPDGREHPGVFRETGRITLLGHTSEVHFRELSVKRLG